MDLDAASRNRLASLQNRRAELIRDLMGDLEVNDAGVGVILNLVDQMHGLRKMLADLLKSLHQGHTPR